ncbi:MAG: hypothetical protein ABI599_14585 [Flavobacteriales bacterium]
MPYPIYRKLIHGRSFYRIDAADRFMEVQLMGSRAIVHEVIAHTYPEKLRMHEMVSLTGGHYAETDAAAFNAALGKADRP